MAIIERDVVLMGHDGENVTIDLPITRLGNLEPSSEDKAGVTDDDMFPVIDSTDEQTMKKISWRNLLTAIQALFAAVAHKHAASDITSGTLPVSRGGTGKTTLSSGQALIGAGTGAVATRAITNNVSTSSSISLSSNLITSSTLRYAINRGSSVAAADTSYTTLMARGTSLNSAETTPAVNGAIAWTYE